MTVRHLWACALLLALAAGARASDPVGIYALIDRVELEPSVGNPDHIRVWGVFSFAVMQRGDQYAPPERGFLYCKLGPKNPEQARKEWNDLKKMAGSGQAVGFGSRYEQKVTLRKGADPTKDPDIYPIGFGLTRVRADDHRTRQLKALPYVLSPVEGEEVAAGNVTLKVKNWAEPLEGAHTTYYFEIEDAKGKKERSKLTPEGNKETSWTPEMKIETGQKYTWRVWVPARKEGEAIVATTTFKGKGGK
jgi:hypothetical protein